MNKGILHIYHYPLAGNAQTILDHVHGLRYSKYGVMECNVALGFPQVLPHIEFEVIVLHYSLFGSGFTFFYDYIDPRWFDYVKDSKAFKVAYFQDEHQYVPERLMFMGMVGIDLAYSLFQPDDIGRVYGVLAPRVKPTLTGYVSETMKRKAEKFARSKRTVDVGYRTRRMAIWRGQGGQDKGNLADGWLLRTKGLRNDVMACEEGRLYGNDWWRFLGNCRFMLGTEAGVSLVDLRNEARHEFQRTGKVSPETLAKWDNNIFYRTISPRHFESAAFGVCQFLHPGYYNGILQPGLHYIPLEKDWSNLPDVLSVMQDEMRCARIVSRAWADLIGSGKYHYRTMAAEFDSDLDKAGVHPSPKTKEWLGTLGTMVDDTLRAQHHYHSLDCFVGRHYARVYRKLQRYSIGRS